MASRPHQRSRHNRIPSGSSTGTAATAASNASTTIAQGPSGPGATVNGNTTSTSTHSNAPSSVRRNLFPQHLSRRIASGSSTSSATGQSSTSVPSRNNRAHNSAPPVAGDGATASTTREPSATSSSATPVSQSVPTTAIPVPSASVDVEIVARDTNGCYKVDVPALPPGASGEEVDEDERNAMEGVEGADAGVGSSGVGPEGEISGIAQESMALLKLDESINDMMRRHRSRQIHGEPSEVFLLIQQSLRNKVASLDDDKWMYEVEEEIRV